MSVPTESQEQITLIQWCNLHPIAKYVFSIPNGSNKSPATAARFKREGLRAGYPDLGLDVARGGYHGLRIELKRTKGGVLSAEQKDWLARLAAEGYLAVVAKGATEAIKIISDYLKKSQP